MRRMLFSILLTLSAATAFAQTAAPAASRGNVLPFKATETSLPNGLKVIIVPTSFPNIVSVQIPVQTGSRNEIEPGKSGFAHFFEHMMFRGTQKYPPEAYDAIITKAGASQNAYTADDYTNYHVTFAKEDLEKIAEIEADRFQSLSYPVAAFKTEARAVLGEYNKNSADPISKLDEVMRDAAFTTHTYKHTAMGFIKDIEDMPNQYEYSKTFFQRWYRPENATIIVAGDVDATKVIAARLARYVRYNRSYATINNAFRVTQSLTADDLATAANTYLTDDNLVVTTLAQQKLSDSIGQIPSLAGFAPAGIALDAKQFIIQKSEIPQLRVMLLFDAGSAHDPAGKEGLARLAASIRRCRA